MAMQLSWSMVSYNDSLKVYVGIVIAEIVAWSPSLWYACGTICGGPHLYDL